MDRENGERRGSGGVAAFATSHPAVPAIYAVLTLGLTMFSMQPMLIALSLAGGLAFGFAVRGPAATLGGLRWQLPLIVIIALVNPLFSASGSTELFRLGTRAVYLESLVYGACMGGMFVASVLWFEAAGAMLSYDKVMALLGNAAPVVALMISMCMRLVPQFMRRGRDILAVQDAIDVGTGGRVGALCAMGGGGPASARPGGVAPGLEGAPGTGAARTAPSGSGVGSRATQSRRPEIDNEEAGEKALHARDAQATVRRNLLASRLRATSVLMGWGMEDSLERADAMRARGWGAAPRRTTYVRWRFGARDAAAVAGLAAGGALTCAIAAVATNQFTFYPRLSALVPWWGYALYAVWMLLPCVLHVLDERRFS